MISKEVLEEIFRTEFVRAQEEAQYLTPDDDYLDLDPGEALEKLLDRQVEGIRQRPKILNARGEQRLLLRLVDLINQRSGLSLDIYSIPSETTSQEP